MKKDCTEEMRKEYKKGEVFFFALVVYIITALSILSSLSNKVLFDLPAMFIGFVGVVIGMLIIFRYLSPRCTNCGLGVLSLIEIKKYPIVLKTWGGKNCWGCGAKLKT